jgi:hypothetical protein
MNDCIQLTLKQQRTDRRKNVAVNMSLESICRRDENEICEWHPGESNVNGSIGGIVLNSDIRDDVRPRKLAGGAIVLARPKG